MQFNQMIELFLYPLYMGDDQWGLKNLWVARYLYFTENVCFNAYDFGIKIFF